MRRLARANRAVADNQQTQQYHDLALARKDSPSFPVTNRHEAVFNECCLVFLFLFSMSVSAPTPTAPSPSDEADVKLLRSIPAHYAQLKTELGKRIVGQDAIILDLFLALIAQGHCFMIGVPGLAKTLLVKSLSEASDLTFRRVNVHSEIWYTAGTLGKYAP
jgi:hypothetical protein